MALAATQQSCMPMLLPVPPQLPLGLLGGTLSCPPLGAAAAAHDDPPRAIFCKGLAKGTSERCIASLFHKFGRVMDCQIARHRSGRSAGFAILVFASHDEAAAAIRAMDAHVFMGRPLSCRWYQQERDGTAEGLLLQLPSLTRDPTLIPSAPLAQAASNPPQHLPLHLQQQPPRPVPFHPDSCRQNPTLNPTPSLPALGMDGWGSLPRLEPSPAPLGEDNSDGARRWSAMVNLWLQDYMNQDSLSGAPSHSLSDPGMAPLDSSSKRRSFDGLPASLAFPTGGVAAERRRSSRDSLSRCLDGLNLAAAGGGDHLAALMPSDSQFLAKSRLATKWSTEAASGGGAAAAAAAATGAAAAASGGGRGSDDFHVLADIKLLSSALPCPLGAPAYPTSTWGLPAAPPQAGGGGFSSAPGTAVNSPPGKSTLQRRGSWGAAEDTALGHIHQDLAALNFAAAQAQQMHGGGGRPRGLQQRAPPPPQQQQQQQQQFHKPAAPPPPHATAAAMRHAQGQGQGHLPGGHGHSHLGGAPVQVQQLAAMQQAQEQYVSALNQLTSAHTQMLFAAAALEDVGILPSLPTPAMAHGHAAPPAQQQPAPPTAAAATSYHPCQWLQGPGMPTANGFALRHPQVPQHMFPVHRAGLGAKHYHQL